MLRRLILFVTVATATAVGSTWWLYQGDWRQAVDPVVPEWDADHLAIRAGIVDLPSARPALEPATGADAGDAD